MLWWFLLACAGPANESAAPDTTGGGTTDAPRADVVGVSATGSPNAYVVSVSIRSTETGCEQYADWWEILDPGGNLMFRRILDHSHPDEQPFTRSSEEPVTLDADDLVIVRAHLHSDAGLGGFGDAMQGTVGSGFAPVDLDPGFAAALETAAPLPEECLF